MGSTSSVYSQDIINDSTSNFVQKILIDNNTTMTTSQDLSFDHVDKVTVHDIGLTQRTTINLAKVSITEINENDLTEMASELGEALKQFQKGGTGQYSQLKVANTIKNTIHSNIDLSTIKKDIMTMLTDQKINVKNILSFKANDINMMQNLSMIRKIISNSISKSSISRELISQLELESSITQTGIFSGFMTSISDIFTSLGQWGIVAVTAIFIVILLLMFG